MPAMSNVANAIETLPIKEAYQENGRCKCKCKRKMKMKTKLPAQDKRTKHYINKRQMQANESETKLSSKCEMR